MVKLRAWLVRATFGVTVGVEVAVSVKVWVMVRVGAVPARMGMELDTEGGLARRSASAQAVLFMVEPALLRRTSVESPMLSEAPGWRVKGPEPRLASGF